MTKNLTIQDLINGETVPCMAGVNAFASWQRAINTAKQEDETDRYSQAAENAYYDAIGKHDKLNDLVNAYNECLPEALSICRDAKRALIGTMAERKRVEVIVENDYFGSIRPEICN